MIRSSGSAGRARSSSATWSTIRTRTFAFQPERLDFLRERHTELQPAQLLCATEGSKVLRTSEFYARLPQEIKARLAERLYSTYRVHPPFGRLLLCRGHEPPDPPQAASRRPRRRPVRGQ